MSQQGAEGRANRRGTISGTGTIRRTRETSASSVVFQSVLSLRCVVSVPSNRRLFVFVCEQADTAEVLWVQIVRLLTQRLTAQWRKDSAVCLSALEVLGGLAKVSAVTRTYPP